MTDSNNPFAPESKTTRPVAASGNPFAEPPRLGISHLLVWTTCVAFYLGIMRSFWLLSPEELEISGFRKVIDGLYGMGSGTALAGLVLFAARRYRRFRFPVHPGEVLLVAIGAGAVLSLAIRMLIWFTFVKSDQPFHWWQMILFMSGLGNALIYVIAAVRVKVTRWRTYLATVAVVSVLHCCAPCLLPWAGFPVGQVAYLPLSFVLAVVVLMDVIQRKKYPWTHWMGVGIAVWLAILGVGILLFTLLGGMALLA